MSDTFNLIDKPWVACFSPDGSSQELGLRAVFEQAHQLRGARGDTPLESGAIYRLLLAILHRVFGPKTIDEWQTLRQAGRFEMGALNDYLERWRGRFDLFDEKRPFYQAADSRVKPKSVINLMPEMASGNNAAWFDHHTEAEGAEVGANKAARVLLAVQAFGLAGLSGLEQKFTDAPCTRGILFLVEGDSLFETLMLNLLIYNEEQPLRGSAEDRPCWEMEDPFQPERTIPHGYLDYLTWQNRRILLLPSQDSQGKTVVREVTVAPALRLDGTVLDPMKHYRKDEQRGELPLRFSEGRALWRDSQALLQLNMPDKFCPPLSLRWVDELVDAGYLSPNQRFRLMALGMATDPGKAKVEFFREEHLPLPLKLLEEEALVEQLGIALEWAEAAGGSLRQGAERLATLVISPKSDGLNWQQIDRITRDEAQALARHWRVESQYWRELEIPFLWLVDGLAEGATNALEEWRARVERAAWGALEQAQELAGQSASALKASVRAGGVLAYGLRRIFHNQA